MLIDYNNKDILNLQEQVLKNTNDINDIAVGQLTIANFGLHVSGILSDSTKLPDVSSYTDDDVGTAYLVGTETPYRLYVLTKIASTGLLEWLDIGNFPQPGPKGDKGDKGDTGATGQASLWYLGSTVPTVDPKYTERDCYLNLTNGNVYYYTSGSWSLYGSLRGPRGSIGATGPQGPQGEQGPIGLTGPKGDTGGLVNILGVVATAEELPSVSTVNDTDAYLVGSTNPYDIYVIIHQPNKQWFNIGTTGSTFSIVNLSVPEGTTSGTLSQGDYNTLQESAQNMIYLNGKYYRLNLDKSTSGYQVYSHTGKNPDNTVYIDEFTITISTKAWVITTINVVDSETLNTKLVGYQKKNSITDIDFPHGEAAVTYDTTNGMGITANVQITNQDGSSYTANGDVHVPIFPGDNITINTKEDGTGVVINGPAAVSKEYVDTELAKKAPLVSSASSTYVTDINGNTTSIPYTPDATAATFCTRDANGNVSVATPTANSHAATKEYVDTHVPETVPTAFIDYNSDGNLIPSNILDMSGIKGTKYISKSELFIKNKNNNGTITNLFTDNSTLRINDTSLSFLEYDPPSSSYKKDVDITLNDSIIKVYSLRNNNNTTYLTGNLNIDSSIILAEYLSFDGNGGSYKGGISLNYSGNAFSQGSLWNSVILGGTHVGGKLENTFYTGRTGQELFHIKANTAMLINFNCLASNGTDIIDSIGMGSQNIKLGSGINRSNNIGNSLIGPYNKFTPAYKDHELVLSYDLIFGRGLMINPQVYDSSGFGHNGFAVVGKYNEGTYTDDQRFIVGAGTSESDRRDCFKTGYDGTDSYITVGSTKVTESQLIQLLALLNPSTT